MRRIGALLSSAVLAAMPLGLAAQTGGGQQAAPAVAKTHLKVGDAAPDFKLKGSNGKTFKLSSFRGKKNVVLAFYVLAFTGG
jgi:cytochrome oxidase Cu insertion factor (SCO1/SenC/PrrC family)